MSQIRSASINDDLDLGVAPAAEMVLSLLTRVPKDLSRSATPQPAARQLCCTGDGLVCGSRWDAAG